MGCGANLKETKQAEVLYLRLEKHDLNKQRQMYQELLKKQGVEDYIVPKVPTNLEHSYKTAKRLEEEDLKTKDKENIIGFSDKDNISVVQLVAPQNDPPITFSNTNQKVIITNASTMKKQDPIIQDPISYLEKNNDDNIPAINNNPKTNDNSNNNINNNPNLLITPIAVVQPNPLVNGNQQQEDEEEYEEGEYEDEEYEEEEVNNPPHNNQQHQMQQQMYNNQMNRNNENFNQKNMNNNRNKNNVY